MARPVANTVEVAVRLPKVLLGRLGVEAQAHGVTVNQWIRDLLVARDLGQPMVQLAPAAQAPEPFQTDAAAGIADEWL